MLMSEWIFRLAGGTLGLGGVALLLWSLFHDRFRRRERCPKCWHDLRGAEGLLCTECGHAARWERELFKTRRRWRLALVALVLLSLGYEMSVISRIRRSGWRGAMPWPHSH